MYPDHLTLNTLHSVCPSNLYTVVQVHWHFHQNYPHLELRSHIHCATHTHICTHSHMCSMHTILQYIYIPYIYIYMRFDRIYSPRSTAHTISDALTSSLTCCAVFVFGGGGIVVVELAMLCCTRMRLRNNVMRHLSGLRTGHRTMLKRDNHIAKAYYCMAVKHYTGAEIYSKN